MGRRMAATDNEIEEKLTEHKHILYMASHDLKQPLRLITTILENILNNSQSPLDITTREQLAMAFKSSENMQNMVEEILQFAKPMEKVEHTPIHLGEVLELALFNLKLLIEETGATIKAETLPVVKADMAQFIRLFQNMISNSIKFCKDRLPKIEITTQNRDNALRIYFKDNGIGIEEQALHTIFTPFKRLNNPNLYKGTGLGLAICKKIVEGHNGSITVKSKPKVGTTMCVTIPLNE